MLNGYSPRGGPEFHERILFARFPSISACQRCSFVLTGSISRGGNIKIYPELIDLEAIENRITKE